MCKDEKWSELSAIYPDDFRPVVTARRRAVTDETEQRSGKLPRKCESEKRKLLPFPSGLTVVDFSHACGQTGTPAGGGCSVTCTYAHSSSSRITSCSFQFFPIQQEISKKNL